MGKEISYLYRIARNLCIDQIRKQKNEALSEELSGCMENIQERMAVPVSYTHLDVYKRQEEKRHWKIWQEELPTR